MKVVFTLNIHFYEPVSGASHYSSLYRGSETDSKFANKKEIVSETLLLQDNAAASERTIHQLHTRVLSDDEGHVVASWLNADETALSVKRLFTLSMAGVKPENTHSVLNHGAAGIRTLIRVYVLQNMNRVYANKRGIVSIATAQSQKRTWHYLVKLNSVLFMRKIFKNIGI